MKLFPLIGLLFLSAPSALAQSQLPRLSCDDQGWCKGGCGADNHCQKIKIIRNNWPMMTHYTQTKDNLLTSETNCELFNGRMNHAFTAVDGVSIEKKWILAKPGSVGWVTSGAACQKGYKDRFIDKMYD